MCGDVYPLLHLNHVVGYQVEGSGGHPLDQPALVLQYARQDL